MERNLVLFIDINYWYFVIVIETFKSLIGEGHLKL